MIKTSPKNKKQRTIKITNEIYSWGGQLSHDNWPKVPKEDKNPTKEYPPDLHQNLLRNSKKKNQDLLTIGIEWSICVFSFLFFLPLTSDRWLAY
jgi:hypothetical protein